MDEVERVRFYVETMTASFERTIKRLWILALILVALLFGTNAAWIWYESQFETETTEFYAAETDDGGTAIVNRDGMVNYGQSDLP